MWSHADAGTSPGVKGEGAGISHDRIPGEEGDLEVFRYDGEILSYGTKVAQHAEGGGKGNGERAHEGGPGFNHQQGMGQFQWEPGGQRSGHVFDYREAWR